jgi:hypothetical protein
MSCGGQGESHGELPSQSGWEYSGAGVTAMDTVADPWDEIVGRYTSAEEAQQNIERFKMGGA